MGMATLNSVYEYNTLVFVLSKRQLNEETNKIDYFWDFAETEYAGWLVVHCKGKWEWQWTSQHEDFHERLFVDLYFQKQKDFIAFCEAFPNRDEFNGDDYVVVPVEDRGSDILRELELWLIDNCKKHWMFDVTDFGKFDFWFADKKDAATFKLVWYKK